MVRYNWSPSTPVRIGAVRVDGGGGEPPCKGGRPGSGNQYKIIQ